MKVKNFGLKLFVRNFYYLYFVCFKNNYRNKMIIIIIVSGVYMKMLNYIW